MFVLVGQNLQEGTLVLILKGEEEDCNSKKEEIENTSQEFLNGYNAIQFEAPKREGLSSAEYIAASKAFREKYMAAQKEFFANNPTPPFYGLKLHIF